MRAIGPGLAWFLPFRRRPGIPPPPASVLNHLRHRPWRPRRILDPGGDAVLRWNRIFLVSCLVALFVDPLYFYLLYIGGPACVRIDFNIGIIVTFFRTVADLFYLGHMLLKFRIAFVAPSSRVFGRGELVTDPHQIAMRYLKGDFFIDLIAMLPIPQVLGALWYLLSIERQYTCWITECLAENVSTTTMPICNPSFLDCSSLELPERKAWRNSTLLLSNCDATNDGIKFNFGMFADALTSEIVAATFIEKYLYCLWWGLKNLSSYGQNLGTSTYIGETTFAILICIMGLVLFSHLIGNMQTYLQSITIRLEEWRVKQRDTEEWMRHRQLPPDLQERVRRFVQYKWLATRGVDEESILQSLPLDLRREIQRHLCLALVRRVPFFSQMDDQLLDAICERLVSSLSTKDTYIVREGDPVNEMLFIIRGQLESSTTNGGRSGFFNSITLGPGDFCGEELLTWALMPNPSVNFPSSTRTVRALSEVEAFALRAEDLKFVASQFKRLHSKKLQHAFRFYSYQWRTWGACFIQAAWRRYKKRKLAKELAAQEYLYYDQMVDDDDDESLIIEPDGAPLLLDYADGVEAPLAETEAGSNFQHLGVTILASKFAKNTKRAHQKVTQLTQAATSIKLPKLAKPDEPDFSMNNDDDGM
ncbi:hypothetical protein C4D60_Mb08t30140 [Musa balbisiana]|uniref:Cyclic nucleotide-binding domain-containing protein n=1 Tax=Musa balbisiana TaxID=52838 RepID=A0A4S8K7J7_MUSBA|nr:hypothetical protein C4D60_Mb08t30140 [Musa balbisiana]